MKIKMFIFAFVVFIPVFAYAHPESGFLPDAIAEMEYKIVLDINPNDMETRNKLGVVLYRKNRLQEAEREFARVLEVSPENFDAQDGMGLVKTKQKNYKEAVKWFKKAIAIFDEDTMVYYHLGFAYEQMGKFADAERSYRKALEVNRLLIQKGKNSELEKSKKSAVIAALHNLQNKMESIKVREK